MIFSGEPGSRRTAENERKKNAPKLMKPENAQPKMESSSRSCRPSPNLRANSKAINGNLRVPFTRYTTRASLRMQTQGAWIPRWHARRCRWLATPSVQMSSDLAINSKNTQKNRHTPGPVQGAGVCGGDHGAGVVPFLAKFWSEKLRTNSLENLKYLTVQCHNVTMSQCHTMSYNVKKC